MLKKTIKYVDYNEVERTEVFFFNLTAAEVAELELSVTGGLIEKIKRITAALNGKEIMDLFKEIIMKAYGEKSDDGRRFVKSHELSLAFTQTEAYSVMFMELVTNPNAGAVFINGIIPQIANEPPVSK